MKKLIRITSIPMSAEKLLGSQLTYMNGFYEVTIVSSNEPELKKVADSLGVRYHAVEMTRKITPLKDLKSVYTMYRFFRNARPDIVHSHTPKAGLVGMMAAWLAGVPVRLHTVAGLPLLEATGFKRWLLGWVERLIYCLCTKVYPNSPELGRIIRNEKFCRPSKLKVLGHGSSNGIDRTHFDPQRVTEAEKAAHRKQTGISENDFVFVFLGRLVKDKGINELVAAFKSLLRPDGDFWSGDPQDCEKAPSLHLRGRVAKAVTYINRSGRSIYLRHRFKTEASRTASAVAEQPVVHVVSAPQKKRPALLSVKDRSRIKLLLIGPLEQEHNPIAPDTLAEIETNPQILSTGYVQEVRPYLAVSHCMVFPSYREGFPNALLQAGAMGLPAITTDINGCNEIITDRQNGLIIPVKDEKALAEAMKKVVQDATLCASLCANSRTLIEEKYSQVVLWEALRNEYRRLLAER